MKLLNLIEDLDVQEIRGELSVDITGVCYDSRKCKKDFLFAALRGANVDGHKFIPAAEKLRAKAVVCEEIPDDKAYEGMTFIKVSNSRKALAAISHKFFGEPSKKLNVIGVTGTNGKTTTSFLIKSIFEAAGEQTALIGTTGIIIGDEEIPATHTTPESLELNSLFAEILKRGIPNVIMEVSSHSLIQERVSYIDFDMAIFTNLTPDHLDYHSDMFEYATAKKKLFDMLRPEAKAIIFDNCEFSEYVARDCKAPVIYVGRNETNDYVIENEEIELGKSGFILKNKTTKDKIEIRTHLSGKFNIENAATAVVTGLESRFKERVIKDALFMAEGAPGRMQTIDLNSGSLAVVDYAHTPDALEKALLACREILDNNKNKGKLICVFGCGGDRDKTKRPIMGNISARIADYTIITSDNPRSEEPDKIIEQIYDGIENGLKSKVVQITNRAEAIKYAVNFAKEDDILLVAGKGHEKYQIIGSERLHFDDIEEIKKYDKPAI